MSRKINLSPFCSFCSFCSQGVELSGRFFSLEGDAYFHRTHAAPGNNWSDWDVRHSFDFDKPRLQTDKVVSYQRGVLISPGIDVNRTYIHQGLREMFD